MRKKKKKNTNLPSSLHQSKASKPDWKEVFLKSCNISVVQSLRKHGGTSLWHQVAGARGTCYYHGDTTQRGILQILIQGSIFIDATMQRAAYHKLTELRATGICHFRVPLPLFSLSAPLASSRSQLLREYSLSSVGVGAKMGALGSLLGGLRARSHLCCSCCGQKPGMSPSSIWDARASW